MRMKLSFYRGLVMSAWLAEEILGKAEDLVTDEQVVEPILGYSRGSNNEHNPRILPKIQQWIRSSRRPMIQSSE
jgi:hypothetical protein